MEGGACVVSSSPPGANRLDADICAPLAQNRINLTFLAHVAGDYDYQVLCTAGEAGETAFTLLKSLAVPGTAVQLYPGTAVLALYPHDKRPEIIGNFIRSLARSRQFAVRYCGGVIVPPNQSDRAATVRKFSVLFL